MSPARGKRRALGQHFLKSESVISKILDDFLEVLTKNPCERILEIGPGKGALTLPLLEKIQAQPIPNLKEILLVEKDYQLGENWSKHATPFSLRTLTADFTDLTPDQYMDSKKTAVLSNLPYSASSVILAQLTQTQMLARSGKIPFMVLMFQAEVAQKICASVGSRECSALTVFVQNIWKPKLLVKVPPSAFSPPPEVDSEVLLLEARPEPLIPKSNQNPEYMRAWERLVRTSFLHRRKMLRSSLKGEPKLKSALDASEVDPTKRPEALNWNEWKAFFSKVSLGFALLLSALTAQANVGESFGYGSRSSSLSGSSAAWGTDGFSAYSNPALMAQPDGKRFLLSWETLWMTADFKPISSIVTENTTISDRSTIGSVDTSYRDTVGQALGAAFRLDPEFYNFTLGFVAYLPMGQALYLDTGEAFLPEYALYRSRTQRPQLDLAVAANFSPWFSAGAGIHIAFALSNQADLFVPSSSSKSSSMRVRSSMKPKAGPYLGFLLAPPATAGSESSWSIGTVIRFPISSPVYFDVNSGAQQIFGAAAIDFNLSATSILQYDPLTIELGTSVKLADRLRSFFQIEFQRWSQYQAPAIQITACKNKPCGLQVADSKNPSPEMKDIWVPKIAQEYAFNSVTTLRAGYSFRPSAVRGPSTGSSNLIDPPKHTFSLGVGFQFKTLLGRNIPCRLDLHAMYQSLVTQRISKTSETEIGAPGYSAGGKIYGGGVSLSLEL